MVPDMRSRKTPDLKRDEMKWTFIYWRQPPYAPRWRGGRIPRKQKKLLKSWKYNHGLAFLHGYSVSTDFNVESPKVKVDQWGDFITITQKGTFVS